MRAPNHLVAKLFCGFFGDRGQSSFGSHAKSPVAPNYRAGSCRLNLKVGKAQEARQNPPININVLNTVIRNSYVALVDDPRLFAKTSLGQLVFVVTICELRPNKTENYKYWNN